MLVIKLFTLVATQINKWGKIKFSDTWFQAEEKKYSSFFYLKFSHCCDNELKQISIQNWKLPFQLVEHCTASLKPVCVCVCSFFITFFPPFYLRNDTNKPRKGRFWVKLNPSCAHCAQKSSCKMRKQTWGEGWQICTPERKTSRLVP